MNRRIRNIVTSLIAACALCLAMPFGGFEAFAASAKISFSDPSTTVGQEFNVTVKVTATDGNLGASDLVLSYDQSHIEFVSGNNANGGAGSVRLVGTMDSNTTKEFAYTLKFKAVQAGDTSISVASHEVYDADTQAVNVTKVGSSAVKVKAPATYSSEAALASLKVSPGQLSPAFSPDVMSYTVNVGGDVDKIAVSADAKDAKAKTKVTGGSGLKTGANTVVCKVTAEDGQTVKSYTITVNKSESSEVPATEAGEAVVTGGAVVGELKADIDGVEYSVASSFDPAVLPAGYTQSTCTYNGTEIMAGTGNGLTLIYLQGSDGNGSFYIYVPESGALSPYVTIDSVARAIVVLPIDDTIEVPEGFAQTAIQLNGDAKVKGWVWKTDEEQKYCVIYGMNENGEKGLYRYDIAEKTFQRYFEDPALESQFDEAQVTKLLDDYNALCKDYDLRFIVIVVLIVVCLILFFMVINLLMRRREHAGRAERDEAPTPVKRRAMQEEEDRRRQGQAARTGRIAEDGMEQRRRLAGDERLQAEQRRGQEPGRTAKYGQNAGYQDAAVRRMAGTAEQGYPAQRRPEPRGSEQNRTSQRRPEQGRSAQGYPERRSPEQGRSVQGYPERRNPEQGRSAQGYPERRNPEQGRSVQGYPERRNLEQSRNAQGYPERRNPEQGRGGAQGYPERRNPEPWRGTQGYPERRNPEPWRSTQGYSERRSPEPGRSTQGYPERSGQESGRSGQGYPEQRYAAKPVRSQDIGMEEAIRQREMERAERARRTRERLERERQEDERRARAARTAERTRKPGPRDDDDFEFLDLN
ncbi:cadherin-like beta sandwich domain-containing protein [[Clostridium] symbiosum]|uniref:cadherin-like beta sandwich domain-containing protein n=1 Tax=Clostridium symbiosum TaxID=1512 RepID=UPI001D084623|nr:cadherin-like beta sandwich domain-containing protein [[Clostridium] symbiosum]MCB6607808.1 cadherin-like beta sandwich domain-containing protein [[Clostridium] symbiosum]MCB6932669.1 cadherin-like beta sandwich domain-containing protein [[Clostridium] symbiosum]